MRRDRFSTEGEVMRRRYTVLGLTGVLAVALAVPAFGGPSNPIASSAASAKQLASKALKKANAANSAAQAAQTTANQALAAANAAQTKANAADANASTVTDNELGLTLATDTDTSPNTAGIDQATAIADCGTKIPISAMGAITTGGPNVDFVGAFIFYEPVAIARERINTGAVVDVTGQGFCIND
jgi:hypothetical protein